MAVKIAGEKITPYNYTPGNISRIKYIVIHYVGALGGAKDNVNYYASRYVGASAHYYVGFNGEIWRSVRDQDIAWSVGGMAYIHPECRNSNSLNIELCVRKKSTKTMGATDKDWYFEDATVKSAIELTKYLMAKYNVPASRVIRHYDVNHKTCPNPYVYNNTKHIWSDFKAALTGSTPTVEEPTAETWKKTGTAICTGQDVRVRQVANGPIIGYLGKNDTVEIDGKTSNGWTHVKAASGIGWVSSQYIKVNSASTPSTNPTTSSSTLYYVKAGDTLTKIAKQYNTTVDALVKANAITDPSKIEVGQTIKIPGTSSSFKDTSTTDKKKSLIKDAQIHLNNFCNAGLVANGVYNTNTKRAVVKALQTAINLDGITKLDVDGSAGTLTKNAYKNVNIRKGKKSNMVTFAQITLMAKGYDPNGVDGSYGNGMYTAVKTFQKDNKLTADGVIGKNTIDALIK